MDANDMKYFDPLFSSIGPQDSCDDEAFSHVNEFEQKIREVCTQVICVTFTFTFTYFIVVAVVVFIFNTCLWRLELFWFWSI